MGSSSICNLLMAFWSLFLILLTSLPKREWCFGSNCFRKSSITPDDFSSISCTYWGMWLEDAINRTNEKNNMNLLTKLETTFLSLE